MPDTPAYWFGVLATVIGVGVLWTFVLIRILRRQSYRSWPLVLRWPFYAFAGSLAAMGGYVLFMLWAERWGYATTIWLLGFPAAWGLWEGWQRFKAGPPSPSA